MGNLVSEMGFMGCFFFSAGRLGSLEFVTEIAVEPAEKSNVHYGAAPADAWRKHICAGSPVKAELRGRSRCMF